MHAYTPRGIENHRESFVPNNRFKALEKDRESEKDFYEPLRIFFLALPLVDDIGG